MNHHRLRVAAIWAICAWPALNFLSANWNDVVRRGVGSLAGVALVTLALAVTGHIVHRLASRKGSGGAVVAFWLVAICLLFGYAPIRDASATLFAMVGLKLPPSVGWVVVAALASFVTFRYRAREKVHFAAVIFCLVVVGGSMITLLLTAATSDMAPREKAPAAAVIALEPARLEGLNVYYIILDAYSGPHGMREARFDNSEFHARMAARGFVDATTDKSNYLTTIQTLGGIFTLDYPQTDDPASWRKPRNVYPDLFLYDQPPALVERLNSAGYTVWHSAAVWGGCQHRHLHCLGTSMLLEPDDMTQTFLSSTPVGRPLLYLAAANDDFDSIISRLPTLLASGRPFFVFGHHMAPHPPFFLDEHCARRAIVTKHSNDWGSESRPPYVGAVKCVNKQVARVIDEILRVNPNALIVVQSDHGSAFSLDWQVPIGSWSEASIRERSSYINFIKAPADCARWLERPLGQINTARFVLACVEGRAPEYLPERTYLSTYSEGPDRYVVRRWGE